MRHWLEFVAARGAPLARWALRRLVMAVGTAREPREAPPETRIVRAPVAAGDVVGAADPRANLDVAKAGPSRLRPEARCRGRLDRGLRLRDVPFPRAKPWRERVNQEIRKTRGVRPVIRPEVRVEVKGGPAAHRLPIKPPIRRAEPGGEPAP